MNAKQYPKHPDHDILEVYKTYNPCATCLYCCWPDGRHTYCARINQYRSAPQLGCEFHRLPLHRGPDIRVLVYGTTHYNEMRAVWHALDRLLRRNPIALLLHLDGPGTGHFANLWAGTRHVPWQMVDLGGDPSDAAVLRQAAVGIRKRLGVSGIVAFPGLDLETITALEDGTRFVWVPYRRYR